MSQATQGEDSSFTVQLEVLRGVQWMWQMTPVVFHRESSSTLDDFKGLKSVGERILTESLLNSPRGVWRGLSKGVEDGHRLLVLQAAIPETAVKPF
jgi:hypothetical protein